MSDADVQFEDAEYTSGNSFKDKITFRDIVLSHVRRIAQYGSVEFQGGYWEHKPVSINGNTTTVSKYVPDSREVYSNAVETLADMLYPYFDSQMKEAEVKARKLLQEVKDEAIVKGDEAEDVDWKIPQLVGNANVMYYRSNRRQILRELFRELCSFLHRKKYLELGSIED